MIADMGSRPVGGLLFKQGDGVTGTGQMQGAFAPGKAAAHHGYGHGLHTFSLPRSLKENPPVGKGCPRCPRNTSAAPINTRCCVRTEAPAGRAAPLLKKSAPITQGAGAKRIWQCAGN